MFTHKQMVKLFILFTVLASLVVACAPAVTTPGASIQEPHVGQGGITVVGRGEACGQPDVAYVHVGVDTFAETVTGATTENEETMQAVMAALTEKGIAGEDIQTSNYSVWAEQVYGDRGPEGIAGYRVSNQVRVKVRGVDNMSEVLAAVINAGANNIYGVNFTVDDQAALEAEAREDAIANARERAESLAELSGVSLGDIDTITEVISQVPYPMEGLGGGGAFMSGGEGAASISPGQLSYQVQVQVTFDIVE
jgi:uncharacterized protein YggE